jgi:hypothetical protein
MMARHFLRWGGLLLLPLLWLGLAARPAVADPSTGDARHRIYTPVVGSAPATPTCEVPGQTYGSLYVAGPPLDFPVAENADVNLGVRGYAPVDAPLKLVSYGPVTDPKAPQFAGMFADNRRPTFVAAYQRYRWDFDCNCATDISSPWPATVLGLGVRPGEVIGAPDSGYDIGGGHEYMVLFADTTRLTLRVGNEDNLSGYVIHLEDVCVEPDLLALYRDLNDAGRERLPVLDGRQPVGRALGGEIKVAIRDSGHFLDPRSRNDWWQGR